MTSWFAGVDQESTVATTAPGLASTVSTTRRPRCPSRWAIRRGNASWGRVAYQPAVMLAPTNRARSTGAWVAGGAGAAWVEWRAALADKPTPVTTRKAARPVRSRWRGRENRMAGEGPAYVTEGCVAEAPSRSAPARDVHEADAAGAEPE